MPELDINVYINYTALSAGKECCFTKLPGGAVRRYLVVLCNVLRPLYQDSDKNHIITDICIAGN